MSTLRAGRGRRRRLLVPVLLGAAALLLTSCTGSAERQGPAPSATTPGAASARAATEIPSPDPEPPPPAGACRDVSIAELRTIVNDEPAVPCRGAHTAVTFHVGELPESATRDAIAPADGRVEAAADRICRSEFRDHVGGNRAARRLSMLTPTYFLPPTEQFTLGAHWVRCDVYAYATPARLADLPRSLRNALEREQLADDFDRCSPVSPSASRFRHVACLEPHRWRAVATQRLGGPEERYPGARTVQNRARSRCEGAVRDYLATDGAFDYGFEVPERDAWAEGDRTGLCWARTDA